MSEHGAVVEWRRNDGAFGLSYDRSHVWRFDSGVEVPASSAPELRGDPTRVDPEEAYVASIASCHMLWFLHLAADAGWTVDSYVDGAVGTMERDGDITWITRVELRPTIGWSGDEPTADEVDALHHESHRRCFIANSVKTAITVHRT
jgi:organic hydroperoxide reductase OsmC/OhrA